MDIKKAVKNLEGRGFKVRFFETKEEAADYLADTIKDTSVGIGGSVTVEQMGLYPRLMEHNKVYWHWSRGGNAPDEMEQAMNARVYLSSANAISEDGEIVNIDGRGNRVAACLHGREKVYIISGVNKLCPNLNAAIDRARNVAAPKNAQRLGKNTPCAAKADKCYDCRSKERICNGMVIHMGKMTGVGETEVVLVNEELGF